MSKYTFQTVVVSAETREAFTSLREELNASDKALFEAIWLTVDIDKVKEKLAEVKPLFGRKKKAAVATTDVDHLGPISVEMGENAVRKCGC